MFTRITKTGDRQYLQLVESFRNDSGKVRTRVVANLGRLDQIAPKQLDPLINGLNRAVGRAHNTSSEVVQEPGLSFGDVLVLHELWQDLGIDYVLKRALRSSRREFDTEALIRAMVFNRLCDPASKLGCLRWLETVAMPSMPDTVTHQHLLRAMDALVDNADVVEEALARQFRPLVDQDLTIAFYDLTTVRIHGEGKVEADIRAYGMNKETGGVARQFVPGVVESADGLPLMHTVHPGNVSETKTLQGMLQKVLARFPVQRIILVADRGLLSLENIGELSDLADQGGRRLEFILAVPARRYADLTETFGSLAFDEAGVAESTFAGHRLIVAHDPVRAKEQADRRRARIRELEGLAEKIVAKLDAQGKGKAARRRRATDRGAYSRFTLAIAEAKLSWFIKASWCDLGKLRYSFRMIPRSPLRGGQQVHPAPVHSFGHRSRRSDQLRPERYTNFAEMSRERGCWTNALQQLALLPMRPHPLVPQRYGCKRQHLERCHPAHRALHGSLRSLRLRDWTGGA